MLKTILIALLPLLLLLGTSSDSLTRVNTKSRAANTGTIKKMIVADGNVAMDVDLGRLNGRGARGANRSILRFDTERNAFFTIIVYNDELRGPLPSSMKLVPQSAAALPAKLAASYEQLVVESLPGGGNYDLAVRDQTTGFTFFNIEGYEMAYEPTSSTLTIQMGRLLVSDEFAAALGRRSDAGSLVGQISISANMRPIEVSEVVEGEVVSQKLPPSLVPEPGTVPGPDVVVGELSGLAQFGSSAGTQVGLAIGTDSCNFGTVPLNWFANPSNDHPVIPQNLYRMSGGPNNDERFEQIGQSSVKHAFTALQGNVCSLGCQPHPNGTALGSGCSDPYGASLNAGPNLGSRAWINPFTGAYPRGDSATPNNSHSSHTHLGPTHRILTEIADLSTAQNPGATYYAEGQYITPHEYVWCQANPGQCNMYNNVSYRRYNVNGTTSPFTFSAAGSTMRQRPALDAWNGAGRTPFAPDPGNDGIGIIAYKVTNPSPGVWHYEYAVYNQNIDRAIQSFSVPAGAGVTISNIGFHAPPQHPGSLADGTVGSVGFSSTPWASTQMNGALTWATETLAQNQNANAIRWGTMYNFRFDSNRPPVSGNVTVGFLKTGAPINVLVQVPQAAASFVFVGGRVTNASGQPVRGAIVSLVDGGTGGRRNALTNAFGYYQFENVATGVSYTVAVVSRLYTFTPQQVTPNDNVTNLDFVANP